MPRGQRPRIIGFMLRCFHKEARTMAISTDEAVCPEELAAREDDGLHVVLWWNRGPGRV